MARCVVCCFFFSSFSKAICFGSQYVPQRVFSVIHMEQSSSQMNEEIMQFSMKKKKKHWLGVNNILSSASNIYTADFRSICNFSTNQPITATNMRPKKKTTTTLMSLHYNSKNQTCPLNELQI